jgi:hypothetical protein
MARNGSSASPASATGPTTVVDIPHELRELGAVELSGELSGPFEGVLDRLGPDVGIAVEVAADPAAETESPAGPVEPLTQCPLEIGHRIPEALLEEPQTLPDLVDDPRAPGADLVRLPQKRDLLRKPVLDAPALRGRRALVVEARKERGHPTMRLEHRAAGRFGGMSGEDQLDGEPGAGFLQRGAVDAAPVELRERLRE